MFVEVQVGVHLKTLDQVAITRYIAHAEAAGVVHLEAFAQRRTHGQVGERVGGGQRDVLEVVQRLRAQCRILEHRPVFLPAIGLDGRAGRLIVGMYAAHHQRPQHGQAPACTTDHFAAMSW